jgi:hypothetical protein
MRHKIIFPLVIVFLVVSLQSFHSAADRPVLVSDFSSFLLYASLNDTTLKPEALEIALRGQKILVDQGIANKPSILTLIDYSLPSTSERLFVIDLTYRTILYRSLVAHGRNSGDIYASRFSNRIQSHQSSLGFFVTGETYQGGQGYSMLMMGLDTGYNDNAARRSVVMHGADYVSYSYIEKYGRTGRSFGCPALPLNITREIIDRIKEGSVIFCYYPEPSYTMKSSVLN